MSRYSLLAAALLVALCGATGFGADRVNIIGAAPVAGEIKSISPVEVVVEVKPLRKNIPVNTIDSIVFEDEPPQLKLVRTAISAGQYAEALSTLKVIDRAELKRPEVKADVEFYEAYARARLAMAGSPDEQRAAGGVLAAFVNSNTTSYHYLAACEALGDLLVAFNNAAAAETYYAKLSQTPWPDYKMRAGVLVARSAATRGDHAAAIKKFDEVLASGATGKDADREKLAATLGKATSMAATGQTDAAVQLVEQVIQKAAPEDRDLHARAYNTQGNCFLAAGKKKDALLAFLHVDLLYAGNPEQHAEALFRLASLWADPEVGKVERANQARSSLREQYPNSAWAKK